MTPDQANLAATTIAFGGFLFVCGSILPFHTFGLYHADAIAFPCGLAALACGLALILVGQQVPDAEERETWWSVAGMLYIVFACFAIAGAAVYNEFKRRLQRIADEADNLATSHHRHHVR